MASSAFQFFGQFFTANTHPADRAGGVADHQGMVGDVFGHDGAGADEGVAADGMATDDGAIGPQRRTFLDKGGADLVHLSDFGPGVIDVCKDH